MLWAMKLLSLNPWAIIGVLAAVGAAVGSSFLYGVNVGGTAADLRCEKRMAAIMRDLEDKKAEVERINKEWQARIDALDDSYLRTLAEENREDAELEKRIADYEQTLAERRDCRLTDDDISRVRNNK